MTDPVPALQIVLSLVGLVAFVRLFWLRYEFKPKSIDEPVFRRFVLVDMLLIVAAFEGVMDAAHDLADVMGTVGDWAFALNMLAALGRGALIAGALALLSTFPDGPYESAQARGESHKQAPR